MADDYAYRAMYALHPAVTEALLVAAAEELGFAFVGKLDPDKGDPLYEVMLRPENGVQEVRFVDDGYVEVSYVVVHSRDRAEHIVLIEKLQEAVDMYTLLDLRELMRQGGEGERILALRGYGAIFDGYWGAIPKDYEEGLLDERRSVREAVLAGMARIGWLEFIPILEDAVAREGDELLRTDMADLLDGLREHGTRGIDQMF